MNTVPACSSAEECIEGPGAGECIRAVGIEQKEAALLPAPGSCLSVKFPCDFSRLKSAETQMYCF